MPAGTCELCGCTEEHACAVPGSCAWASPEETLCSACVGWAKLKPGHLYSGIFGHDLVPVLDILPKPVFLEPLGRVVSCVLVDTRRLDQETIERLALRVAPECGGTVADFLLDILGGKADLPLRWAVIEGTINARSIEHAAALVPMVRAGLVPTLEMCFGQEVYGA